MKRLSDEQSIESISRGLKLVDCSRQARQRQGWWRVVGRLVKAFFECLGCRLHFSRCIGDPRDGRGFVGRSVELSHLMCLRVRANVFLDIARKTSSEPEATLTAGPSFGAARSSARKELSCCQLGFCGLYAVCRW